MQGDEINLSGRKKEIYEGVFYENAVRNHIEHDIVLVHDPQPLPIIIHYRKRGPWIWRCHVDLSNPDRKLWKYLVPFMKHYDAVILSCKEYAQNLQTPQLVFMPAIDPFSPFCWVPPLLTFPLYHRPLQDRNKKGAGISSVSFRHNHFRLSLKDMRACMGSGSINLEGHWKGKGFPRGAGTRIRLRKLRVHMIRREIEHLLNEVWRVTNLICSRLKH